MAEVKWIKLKVGMFDGMSFKKIKRAKIGGESFRDKLTAVWFELMDFAGKCNQGGAFISPQEIPFKSLSDIATMIDREEDELQLCMTFFVNEGMVSIIDDVYMLSNWEAYQNTDRLSEIREYNRLAKQKSRARQKLLQGVNDKSMTGQRCHDTDIDIDKELDTDIERNNIKDSSESTPPKKRFVKPSLEDVEAYCRERGNSVNAQRFIDHYESNGWKVGKNSMKDWKAAVRTWEKTEYNRRDGYAVNRGGYQRNESAEEYGLGEFI